MALPEPSQNPSEPRAPDTPPDSTPHRPKPTWGRYLWQRLQWSLILLTWYLLLVGPLFWTWHHAVVNSEPSWVEYCYRPLVYACEIPVIRKLVNAYIDLWIL